MSKVFYVHDPGHGGIIGGKYVTAGKRSPHPVNGTILYEGVNNRDNVNRVIAASKLAGLEAIDIVSTNEDISLSTRVARANKLTEKRKTMYLSHHSDAANGGDLDWVKAKGITVYTYVGQSPSDDFASILIERFEKNMSHLTTIRKDITDGDKDKEAKFYVLEKTKGDSVLIEGGFHTDKEEAACMLTEEWKSLYTKSVIEACLIWETKK